MSRVQLPPPPPVSLQTWRELYLRAEKFQQLAPWEWMNDTDILAIQGAAGPRLCSVLGGMGEIFGCCIYHGSRGINYLLGLLDGEISPEGRDAGCEQQAFLLDYVPRAELRKEDKAILKELAYKPTNIAGEDLPLTRQARVSLENLNPYN